jgi:hypothetical protein
MLALSMYNLDFRRCNLKAVEKHLSFKLSITGVHVWQSMKPTKFNDWSTKRTHRKKHIVVPVIKIYCMKVCQESRESHTHAEHA